MRVPRAEHSDARVDHEIKACRARFREDSLAADVVQAADAAGEEVAEGAQAPWVGIGLVVMRQARVEVAVRRAVRFRDGNACFRIGGLLRQNPHWEAGNADFRMPVRKRRKT